MIYILEMHAEHADRIVMVFIRQQTTLIPTLFLTLLRTVMMYLPGVRAFEATFEHDSFLLLRSSSANDRAGG